MQMIAQNSLDHSIRLDSIGISTKCEILNNIWDFNVQSTTFYHGDSNYDAYFAYYAEQCSLALHDGGRHMWARTHRDIIETTRHLKNSLTRNAIKELLRPKLPVPKPDNEEELLDSSIDLAARLLLMMEFGCFQYGFSGLTELVWVEGSLEDFIKDYFRTSQSLGQESVKLDRIFIARNLRRIAGIEIEWTKNLADHLRLIDDDKKVMIFHYASFLECQQKSQMFPSQLIEETLRTIALLFPQTDNKTKKWFKKEGSTRNLDSRAIKCGRLKTEDRQIEKFEFWHDRLVVLKQFFDEAEPSTLSQWWFDRRKRVQWYTFWIAALVLALTVFFGLVQCVEGGLQAYKAFYPSS